MTSISPLKFMTLGLLLEVVAGTALALLLAGALVSKDMRALARGGESD